jgi:energy-coupling factor transporter transmembrane protein EcfT
MTISWQVHKAKESLVKTIFTLIIIILFIVFIFFFGKEYRILWIILSLIVLFATLNAYFLPTTYTITDTEIIIDKKLFINKLEWSRFRKYYLTTTGIVLSPFTKRNFLDNFRGVHLLLPKENPQEIINFIKNKLDKKEDLR